MNMDTAGNVFFRFTNIAVSGSQQVQLRMCNNSLQTDMKISHAGFSSSSEKQDAADSAVSADITAGKLYCVRS